MRFSPLLVSSLIVKPLRYFFSNYTKAQGLVWNEDEKIRTIEVDSINNFNNIKIQGNPRVLVNRGNYIIRKSGLTDNRTNGLGIKESFGSLSRTNTIWINGQAQIVIEARNEGTCELVTDMVSHFLVWSRPLICDTQGFNEFGLDMQVSDCTPDKEDTEKFKSSIVFPYSMEEQWNVDWDTLKIKSFYLKLDPLNSGQN